jgi:hypothetical protein
MDGSTNSSDSGFEVHEVIFAESLGVNLQEEFALELLDIATRALYILPEGWEVDFAESELGSIPFFYDSNTEQSHWVHPYAQDLKMLIEEKRLQLLRGEDLFNEEDELEEDESSMYEDAEDISTNRVNESFELEALPSRLKPVDGFPEESEDAQSLSEPMPQISETEEVSEKNEQLDTVEPVDQILQPTVDSNAPDTPNGVSSDKLAAVTDGPSDETKDATVDESTAVDTIAPIVQSDEQLEGIGAAESSKESQKAGEAEVVMSSDLPEQQAGDSTATIEPPIETAASSESKDPSSEQLISSPLEHVEDLSAPLQTAVETATVEEPTVEVPVDEPVVVVDEAPQVVEEHVEMKPAETVDVVPENASVDAPDTVQPEAPASVEIPPVVDSDASSSSDAVVPVESSAPQAEVETTEPPVAVEESAVVTTELPIEEVVAAPAPAEAAQVVVEEAAASTPTAAEEPASIAADTTPPVETTVPVEEAPPVEVVATSDSAPADETTVPVEEAPSVEVVATSDSALAVETAVPVEEAPPVEVVTTSDSAPAVDEEPTPEPVAEEEPTPVPAQPATPEKMLPLALPQAATPPQQAPQEQQQTPTTTVVQAQESQSQKSTPKSARPLPVDPFADFFSIDPSLHTFIDTLEKKKKKKAQQKAQGKGKKNTTTAAAVANDDDVASVDIDEILRRRRQTERVNEEARVKREQEVEAKRLAAQQKKRAAEEEALRAEQEKVERERQERLAEEARRKKEADDAAAAAAALTVTVPAVTAPSPPSLDRTLTLSDDLAATTKSLFDDLVAKESVPEEEEDDNGDAGARLSVSRSVDRFGLSSPVTAVPLDRSIDILDHFRNIYSAGSGSANEQPSPIPHAPTSASGTSRTLLRQASVRYVPGVASMAEAHDGATDSIVHKPRGLDTTKLVTRDPATKKRKKAAAAAAAAASEATGATSSSGTSPPPKLKPHVTTADGWVVLGAYANYKEAERAVALFEALAPTKSIAGQSFPSHSKFLPPVKGPEATGAFDGTTMGDGDAVNTSPLKKKSLLASNAPITKESILLSTQQELPQTRIARDLGRMQWLVECNDPSMKKVFERRIAKRLRHGQGAEKLLAHLSPAKQQALGLDVSSPSAPIGGDGKAMDSSSAAMMMASSSSSSTSPLKNVGRKFTAAFTPQALISNKNTKHVSGQMHVQYPLPRVAYDDKKPLPTMMSSLSPTNRNHSNNNNNNNQHRGPATFRAVLHDAAAATAAASTTSTTTATGGAGSGKSVHSSPGGRRNPAAMMQSSSVATRGGGGGGTMRPASTYT